MRFSGKNVLVYSSNMQFVNKDNVYLKIMSMFSETRASGRQRPFSAHEAAREQPHRGQIFWNLPLALVSL